MAIQSNGASILESSSSDRTEIIIQAPRPTFIINSTFASYLMLPQTPAPALAFTTANRHSRQSLAGRQGLRSKQGRPPLHGLVTSFSCGKACAPLPTTHHLGPIYPAVGNMWLSTAIKCWRYLEGSTLEGFPALISQQQRWRWPHLNAQEAAAGSLPLLHSEEFVSGYITLSKVPRLLEMQFRFQVYLYTQGLHTYQEIYTIKPSFL